MRLTDPNESLKLVLPYEVDFKSTLVIEAYAKGLKIIDGIGQLTWYVPWAWVFEKIAELEASGIEIDRGGSDAV